MKEKIFRTLSCIFLVLAAFLLVGCDQKSGCEHKWGEWTTESAATCVNDGTQKRVCTICEESETNAIPATGFHVFSQWETITQPTVLKEGEKKRTCACGLTQSKKISVLKATDRLSYALVNGGAAYEVYGIGAATDTDIIIPATFEGKPVIGIGDSAFYGCSNLTSITFFENITSIGNYAFVECDSLTEITIPVSVTAIGVCAFAECSSLTSITIPDSVTAIGNAAFAGCSSLKSITIPGSVTAIGTATFEGCSSLTSIVIPAGVTEIGSLAFYNCNALTAVYITDLTAWCNILFADSASNPCYYAHNLYLNSELITDLVIPEGTDTIGDYAFYGCNSLTSITIPKSVTAIDNSAFNGCSNLTLITIPASVTAIAKGAFKGCSGLASVIFESTSYWHCTASSLATSISASDLANTTTAAMYLTSTYCQYAWERLPSDNSQKEVTEKEWHEAFAFENVRVDCTRQNSWQQEPSVGEPLYSGTHYLFDGIIAAVANAKRQDIGSEEPIIHEKLFVERLNLIRLFDFTDCFEEFALLENGIYFCQKSSLKNIIWEGDCIKNVYVTFTDGQISKISYTYCPDSTGLVPTSIYTFTFSEYGQVELEAPVE